MVWAEKLTGSTAAKIIFVYGKTLNFDVLGNPGIFNFFLLTVSDATKNFDSAIVDCMSFQIPLICIIGLLKPLSALLLRR